tara:strand:- start:223 stop:1383 length:1161 start_codon:yes stop_codon:yes gene_type:complete
MSDEDDSKWDDTDYTEVELQNFMYSLKSIYVSNNPYAKWIKRKVYLIDGLIADRSINIFYGDPKVAKSLLLVNIATSLVSGGIWADLKTANCLTVYLAFEDPEGIRDRLTLSSIKKRLVKGGLVENLQLHENPPDIFAEKFLASLSFMEAEWSHKWDHKIIIIDTLSLAMSRLGDENSSVAMGVVIDTCRKMRDLGYTVFIVHHTGKDQRRGLRGHKSLQAAADSVFLVKKKPRSSIVNVERIEYRNGPGGEQFNFEIKTDFLEYAPNVPVPYLEFLGEVSQSKTENKPSHREVAVLNLLRQIFDAESVNIKLVFGLDRDCYAVQYAQLLTAFIAANIAPQAKSKASQAKALTRVLESLAEKGLINERNGFYWFPENEQTNDDKQT